MKARVTIIGNLTKDAENFVIQKSGKEYCKFTVAVNYLKDKSVFFVDCILNVPLSDERLKLFEKGTLCTFVGRYKEEINEKDGTHYLNRTLFVSDFFASKTKSPFYKNMSVNLVGYLLDKPKEENEHTTFVLMEKPFGVYGIEDNKRYICKLNYKLSDKAKEKMQENDISIYVYGYYDESIQTTFTNVYIDRQIELKDFEILDRPIQQVKIGDFGK